MKLGRVLSENRTDFLTKVRNVVYVINNESHSLTRPDNVSASDLITSPEKRTRPGAPTQSTAELIEKTVLHYLRYRTKRNTSAIVKGVRVKFKVGDRVRLVLEPKSKFTKISDQQFTTQVYTIVDVIRTNPLASYILSWTTPDRVVLKLAGSYPESKLKRDFSSKT